MIFTNFLIANLAIRNRNRGVSVQTKFLSWLISTFKMPAWWFVKPCKYFYKSWVNVNNTILTVITFFNWIVLAFGRAWQQTIGHNNLLHFARYTSVIGTKTGISVGFIIDKASTHSNTHSLRYFAKAKKRTESEVLNKKMNWFFYQSFPNWKYWERTRVRDGCWGGLIIVEGSVRHVDESGCQQGAAWGWVIGSLQDQPNAQKGL